MILTNCNCGEKIDCGCTLNFSSYVQNSVSVLDVGVLQGGSCEFDEYVIDWYRNGELYMTSGEGNEPDIQAFHPFTGTAAIPVLDGTYVPKLRYVVIDGVQIFSGPRQCVKWCPGISTELPMITVSALNCGSTNISGNYKYRLSYTATQDFSMASRKVAWTLVNGVKYFAVRFTGASISDKIEIFYNDENNLLSAYIIGNDVPAYDDSAIPYKIKTSFGVSFVVEMPEYTDGDFLIIKVTPAIYTPTENTIWTADFRCLMDEEFDYEGECSYMDENLPDFWNSMDVDNIELIDNVAACSYQFVIPYTESIRIAADFPFLNKYAGYSGLNISNGSHNYMTNKTAILATSYRTTVTVVSSLTENITCTPADGKITISRIGTVLKLNFTSPADYNKYKNRFGAINQNFYNGWVNDDTDIAYYRYMAMLMRGGSSCGDVYDWQARLAWHITSDISFDDNNYVMEIDVKNPTINLSQSSCVDWGIINTYRNHVITTLSGTDFLGDTYLSTTSPMEARAFTFNVSSVYSGIGRGVAQQVEYKITAPCLGSFGCVNVNSFRYYITYMDWAIIDPNDPLNNWVLYNRIDHSTGCLLSSANRIKIKEVVNGVQVYPL